MNRGVTQLARLDVAYSLTSGSSSGVREFVKSPLMAAFQKTHPNVKFQAKLSNKSFPIAEAHYRQHDNNTRHITAATT